MNELSDFGSAEEAEARAIQDLDDHRKNRLALRYVVEVDWPENGGMWVGVTIPKPGTSGFLVWDQNMFSKKFDREDTIGDVRDWIFAVRLGEVAS